MRERDRIDIVSVDSVTIVSFVKLGWHKDVIGGEPTWHVDFLCLFRDEKFSGQVSSSTHLVPPVSSLFEDMAMSWRGWAVRRYGRISNIRSSYQLPVTARVTLLSQ